MPLWMSVAPVLEALVVVVALANTLLEATHEGQAVLQEQEVAEVTSVPPEVVVVLVKVS